MFLSPCLPEYSRNVQFFGAELNLFADKKKRASVSFTVSNVVVLAIYLCFND